MTTMDGGNAVFAGAKNCPCITYTLRFSARYFLALTKKAPFLEAPERCGVVLA